VRPPQLDPVPVGAAAQVVEVEALAVDGHDGLDLRIVEQQRAQPPPHRARCAGDRDPGHRPTMQPMSGFGPTGGDDPFEGVPFLGDLGRLLGGAGAGGGLQWDTARQMAMQGAPGGESEPNIDPIERMDVEQLGRVADLHVAQKTGLSTSVTGRSVQVVPVTRLQWVQRSLDAYKPLFESLASSLASAPLADPSEVLDGGEGDPMTAMLTQLMSSMAPMMLGVTAGGMIGHLARRSFGQYDLPVPRQPSDELLLVLPNVTRFADDWSIDRKDLLLWLCIHEIAHHAVLGVPHVRGALERMLREYAAGFRPDASGLLDKLGALDVGDPTSSMAELQGVLGDPEVVLGAIQTDEQRALLPRLEALVAVIEGYVDHVMDAIGGGLISSYGMITEAARRRRVEADESDRFVARLFGLELGQPTYDACAACVDGVVERAGFDALEPLWEGEANLPTPPEIEAPGLWLARLELDA
jgi:putative hydrolase